MKAPLLQLHPLSASPITPTRKYTQARFTDDRGGAALEPVANVTLNATKNGTAEVIAAAGAAQSIVSAVNDSFNDSSATSEGAGSPARTGPALIGLLSQSMAPATTWLQQGAPRKKPSKPLSKNELAQRRRVDKQRAALMGNTHVGGCAKVQSAESHATPLREGACAASSCNKPCAAIQESTACANSYVPLRNTYATGASTASLRCSTPHFSPLPSTAPAPPHLPRPACHPLLPSHAPPSLRPPTTRVCRQGREGLCSMRVGGWRQVQTHATRRRQH